MENVVTGIPNKDTELLDEIVKSAAETAEKNEDISHLRDIIENKEEVINHDPSITSEVATFAVRPDGKPDLSHPLMGDGQLKEADLSINEMDQLDQINEKGAEDSVKSNPMFDLTDEEAYNITQIVLEYKNSRNKHNFPVYSKMLSSVQKKINKLCFDMGTPLQEAPLVARYVIEQFYSNVSENEQFIDIEKALDKAMKIPSMVDIYMDHVNETMDVKLPALAEEYAKREPEKAEKIIKIKEQYNASYLFDRLRHMYDTNPSIRKAVRKNWDNKDVAKYAAEANYYNSMTNFKMPDCTAIPNILENLMETRGYSKTDPVNIMMINKFCVLLFSAVPYLDLHDLLDAAFYYYSIKNISMMAYVGEKLSDFSEELISNINITIGYIAYREAEVQNANQSNKHKPKRSKRNPKH